MTGRTQSPKQAYTATTGEIDFFGVSLGTTFTLYLATAEQDEVLPVTGEGGFGGNTVKIRLRWNKMAS
jgi:hypothetical protein